MREEEEEENWRAHTPILVKAKKPSFLNRKEAESVWRFLEVIMFDKSLSSLCSMTVMGRRTLARHAQKNKSELAGFFIATM